MATRLLKDIQLCLIFLALTNCSSTPTKVLGDRITKVPEQLYTDMKSMYVQIELSTCGYYEKADYSIRGNDTIKIHNHSGNKVLLSITSDGRLTRVVRRENDISNEIRIDYQFEGHRGFIYDKVDSVTFHYRLYAPKSELRQIGTYEGILQFSDQGLIMTTDNNTYVYKQISDMCDTIPNWVNSI